MILMCSLYHPIIWVEKKGNLCEGQSSTRANDVSTFCLKWTWIFKCPKIDPFSDENLSDVNLQCLRSAPRSSWLGVTRCVASQALGLQLAHWFGILEFTSTRNLCEYGLLCWFRGLSAPPTTQHTQSVRVLLKLRVALYLWLSELCKLDDNFDCQLICLAGRDRQIYK